jgi:hypothetical protein
MLGELHPHPQDCQRHPLILDGLFLVHALRRAEEESACTFYLVSKEPVGLACPRRRTGGAKAGAFPVAFISFRGTFQY